MSPRGSGGRQAVETILQGFWIVLVDILYGPPPWVVHNGVHSNFSASNSCCQASPRSKTLRLVRSQFLGASIFDFYHIHPYSRFLSGDQTWLAQRSPSKRFNDFPIEMPISFGDLPL